MIRNEQGVRDGGLQRSLSDPMESRCAMKPSRIVPVIAVACALYYLVGASHLLGTPDPLMGTKTVLFLISSVVVFALVEWLNRRDEG